MEIWLNPACSKCRAAVSQLDAAGAEYTVRRYLDDPPSAAELTDVLERLGLEPWDITRTGEAVASDLGVEQWPRDAANRSRWIAALAAHPQLIQRPIITADDGTTVVGRSTDEVRRVLDRRPRRERATVRVLLVDDRDRLLLFRDSDPGLDPVRSWWILPGGGIDPGEDEITTVVRELGEETGLRVDRSAVAGPLARRRVLHGYSDQVVDQRDAFYLVRTTAFEVSTAGHTADEQITLLQHRWWSRAEVAASEDEIWPVLLPELWDLASDPSAWPVNLDDVEESSVPL